MTTSPLRSLLQRGWLGLLTDLSRFMPPSYRIAFLGAGLRAGILQRLAQGPTTPEQLAADLGYDTALLDGLRSWLDLGVTLGELRESDGRYELRSRRAKALVKPDNDAVAAFYEELATLDHQLIVETPTRLAEGRPFELADADADLIARSSRMSEPWITAAIEGVVPGSGTVRLLEVGCGSGAHIRTAAKLNPELTAVGLELQDAAAQQARTNIAAWGLDDRVQIQVGDVRHWDDFREYDLVTLHQNIYYFPEAEQTDLLRQLRGYLAPGGTLLATTLVRGGGVTTSGLDLWGAMTDGASRLPVTGELVERFQAAGFSDVEARKLGPDGLYRAFVGRA